MLIREMPGVGGFTEASWRGIAGERAQEIQRGRGRELAGSRGRRSRARRVRGREPGAGADLALQFT